MLPGYCSRCSWAMRSFNRRLELVTVGSRWTQVVACRRHSSSGAKQMPSPVAKHLVDSLQTNLNWFNQRYEQAFGIAEMREMQAKVLEVEREFRDITQRRKACQDRIENCKEEIKNIPEEGDGMPSDKYLRLITEEHKLKAELGQLKKSELLAMENLSKMLRQSHEHERLRLERSKYWQIVSLSLSLVYGLVVLIRSEKCIMALRGSLDEKFTELDKSLLGEQQLIKANMDSLKAQIERQHLNLTTELKELKGLQGLQEKRRLDIAQPAGHRQSWASWLGSWIPGKSLLKSASGYLW